MHDASSSSARRLLLQAGVACAAQLLARPAGAQDAAAMAAALADFAGGQAIRPGRVRLEIASLVDNGNVVPMRVTVDSPMTAADRVTEIAVYNEKNPLKDVIRATLGPRAGKAELATRIRLATSQKLVALARMGDGSVWSDTVDVIVVLAACVEGDS